VKGLACNNFQSTSMKLFEIGSAVGISAKCITEDRNEVRLHTYC
jgi:hypothetical protein